MITRVAVGFLVIATAAVALSSGVFARGAGGFVGGRGVSAPPRVPAHPATPAVVHPGRSLVGGIARAPAFGRSSFGHHRGRFGNRAWGGRQWYNGWYGPYDYGPYDYGDYSYYDGTGYIPPYAPTPAYQGPGYPVGGSAPDTAQKIIYVLPYRPGCDSETQKVPGKGGGEHSVTIVRC
jgi:hypothetical protein